MRNVFNVYCDESCHLEGDGIPAMVLGAVWCSKMKSRKIARDIRDLQVRHGLKSDFEIKWTKVSRAKQDFYCALVDYFFDNPDLHFRGVVIPDKTKLNHGLFGQNHDLFYYKMFFYVLRNIITSKDRYRIFLDIKDTQGRERLDALSDVLVHGMGHDQSVEAPCPQFLGCDGLGFGVVHREDDRMNVGHVQTLPEHRVLRVCEQRAAPCLKAGIHGDRV